MRSLLALLAPLLLGACVSVGIGGEARPHAHLALHDVAGPVERLDKPIVSALLIQPLPADALGDTLAIAYSRRPNEFAFYQFASWTERPVRQLPRLLQRRLEARGLAGAVGVFGDPLRADWLITLGVDALYHDVVTPPGQARFALTAEIFDRRSRTRIARRQFVESVPATRADSVDAAAALSSGVARVFDALVPWIEGELKRAAPAGSR